MKTIEDIRGLFCTLVSLSVDASIRSPTAVIEVSTIDGELIKVRVPLESYDKKKYIININQTTLW